MNKKTIYILNSHLTQFSFTEDYYLPKFDNLCQILNLHFLCKKEKLNLEEWSFKVPTNTPQQNNGYDCGPLSCYFSECIINKKQLESIDAQKKRLEIYDDILKERKEIDQLSRSQEMIGKSRKPEGELAQIVQSRNYQLDEDKTKIFNNKPITFCTLMDLQSDLN